MGNGGFIYTLFIEKILMRFSSSIYAFKKLTFIPSCLNFWTSSFLYWRPYRNWGQPRSNAFAVTSPVHYKIYLLSMEDLEQVAENLRFRLWDHGCSWGRRACNCPPCLRVESEESFQNSAVSSWEPHLHFEEHLECQPGVFWHIPYMNENVYL